MAHYAFLDENNIVTHVIVGNDENGETDWEQYYSEFANQPCKRTSYNTHANQHSTGGTPFRGNYAGPGYFYDAELDAFIPPKPYASWVLDTQDFSWKAPVPAPETPGMWVWDEGTLSWITP